MCKHNFVVEKISFIVYRKYHSKTSMRRRFDYNKCIHLLHRGVLIETSKTYAY